MVSVDFGLEHFSVLAMMLPGPELFFQHAKSIMPWHDEPDSPRVGSTLPVVTPYVHCHAQEPSDSAVLERSPHDELPVDWQIMPKAAGVTIRVLRPSLTVGQILHHCKDWVGEQPVLPMVMIARFANFPIAPFTAR